MHAFKKTAIAALTVAAFVSAPQAFAKTVKVTMTAQEVDVQTNGALVGGASLKADAFAVIVKAAAAAKKA